MSLQAFAHRNSQAHNAQDWHGWTALHASAAHGKKVGAESATV